MKIFHLPNGGYRTEYPNHTSYYNAAGLLHRIDGPAIEWANGGKVYCINDKLHRIDGPAIEQPDGYHEYWLNGREVTAADMPNLTLEDLLR